jgi:hypothetical protein
MADLRPPRPKHHEIDEPSVWMERREIGRLLRLIGPLVQVPMLWILLRKPDLVREHPEFVYGGMALGLILVLTGLLISSGPRRSS